ncbi:MAG: cytochrome C biogenesis protein, partial [Draconibacterium sp.]
MKKFLSFIFSMFFTGILLVVFAIAIGYATFIENDYGTITAKILIYNSKWFEILMIVLTINLIGSIFKYELFTKKKWTVLLFHLSFIVILIGAAITR